MGIETMPAQVLGASDNPTRLAPGPSEEVEAGFSPPRSIENTIN